MKTNTEFYLMENTFASVMIKDLPEKVRKIVIGNYPVWDMVKKTDVLIAFKLEEQNQ